MGKMARCDCGHAWEVGDDTEGPVACPSCGQPVAPADMRPDWYAITSLILGILSLGAWFLPCCGAPVTVTGLVFGILGLKSRQRTLAIVGIVLTSIGLLATLVNAGIGIYLGATGQHPLLQPNG
jgi:hypothetical protein